MISTKTRIARSLGRSQKKTVFLRSDFEAFGSSTRVTRALQELIAEGRVVRVGRGIYVKARRSSVTGSAVPVEPLETVAHKALAALGVDAHMGSADEAYVGGDTQDVPMRISIDVGSSRIVRRIEFGGRERDLIQDVSNEGLSSYSISALEKDLHLGSILGLFRLRHADLPEIVLCGGTSLVKGHKLIARMSEDMDFKVSVSSDSSNNKRASFLSRLKEQISTLLAEEGFVVENVSAHNRNSFFSIELRYSPAFTIETALRPHILLEFTAEPPFLPPVFCQSGSLLGQSVPEELHPVSFPCLQVEETVAEKSVAFLRRSRRIGFASEESHDSRLVRHIYDIGSIGLNGVDFPQVDAAFVNAMERDARKYVLGDPEFGANPRKELAQAADGLDISALNADYEVFVESLVAGPAVSFDQAFKQFHSLVGELLR